MTHCKPLCAAALFLVLLTAGCARPTARIDSLGEAHRGELYLIKPGQANVRPDDLYFAEYKGQVARLLKSLGYQVTEDDKQATAAVLLSYDARMFGDSGGSSDTRVGIGMGTGSYHGRDWDDGGWSPGGSFFGLGLGFPLGGGSSSSPRWRYMIVLDAVAFAAKGAAKEQGNVKSLWKTSITSTGDDGDLRSVFPDMLDAAAQYIGRDSKGSVTVKLQPQ